MAAPSDMWERPMEVRWRVLNDDGYPFAVARYFDGRMVRKTWRISTVVVRVYNKALRRSSWRFAYVERRPSFSRRV